MIVVKRALCGALDALGIGPNHALQRTAAGRRGLRRRASWDEVKATFALASGR